MNFREDVVIFKHGLTLLPATLPSRAILDRAVIVKQQRPCLGRLLARAASLILVASFSASSHAQEATSEQIWTNYILAFPRSEKLYYEMDIETAHQVGGGEAWHYYYGTGMLEYYPAKLVDLTAELVSGHTNQAELEDSFELSAYWYSQARTPEGNDCHHVRSAMI